MSMYVDVCLRAPIQFGVFLERFGAFLVQSAYSGGKLVHFVLIKQVSATLFPSLSSPPSPFGTFSGANALSGPLLGACGPQVTLFAGGRLTFLKKQTE